jgi:hypothetical protein
VFTDLTTSPLAPKAITDTGTTRGRMANVRIALAGTRFALAVRCVR